MPLFDSAVYDAFREVGVSHDKALAAAVALSTPRPASPSLPLVPLPAWPVVVAVVLLAGCLFFAGYVVCQDQHQATRTRALLESLPQLPQP